MMTKTTKKRKFGCKFPNGFFYKHPHDVIRGMPGGREALLLYLELLLESSGHDGHLLFNDHLPFTPQLLSVKFQTPIDIIEKSLALLESLELVIVNQSTKEILLPEADKYVDKGTLSSPRLSKRGKLDDYSASERFLDLPLPNIPSDKSKPPAPPKTTISTELGDYPQVVADCGLKSPTLDMVLAVAQEGATKRGGMAIPEEFARKWYSLMSISRWRDTENKLVVGRWQAKLGFAWLDEQKRMKEREKRQKERIRNGSDYNEGLARELGNML